MGKSLEEVRAEVIFSNNLICCIGTLFIIIYSLYQFSRHEIRRIIRNASLAVFSCSFLWATLDLFLWRGLFTSKDDCFWINLIGFTGLTFYKLSLWNWYILRLDLSFKGSVYETSPKLLRIARISILVLWILLR